jgi:hypothetical protein
MKTSDFRALMSEGQADLEDIRSALLGARAGASPDVVKDTERVYHECAAYLDKIVLGYLGEPGATGLSGKEERLPWPRPGQSPASIWVDMQFLMHNFWDKVEEHDDIDPECTFLLVTSRFLNVFSVLAQKLRIAKSILAARDPNLWTDDKEAALAKIEEYVRDIQARAAR